MPSLELVMEGTKVHFSSSDHITITGDFDQWQHEKYTLKYDDVEGVFRVEVPYSGEKELIFKFVLNGTNWTTVECFEELMDGEGHVNNRVFCEDWLKDGETEEVSESEGEELRESDMTMDDVTISSPDQGSDGYLGLVDPVTTGLEVSEVCQGSENVVTASDKEVENVGVSAESGGNDRRVSANSYGSSSSYSSSSESSDSSDSSSTDSSHFKNQLRMSSSDRNIQSDETVKNSESDDEHRSKKNFVSESPTTYDEASQTINNGKPPLSLPGDYIHVASRGELSSSEDVELSPTVTGEEDLRYSPDPGDNRPRLQGLLSAIRVFKTYWRG
ncbi:Atg45p Ecym_4356 [Eremothecium cymbalariae DBVPG|uniref:AMP-activated protein kinase glycogen-binding domain-containing protein n=1 Tax=Eremothecium cymbalariae (strain CBS 270.75 / DBVPG 7215 / KCTC 17166 / NRRL Y-17582) TaxID=931890 RepID=G8JTR3_ERECY|nr:hypothetical protein Ecym_4356 [Eremothecium cymbalariae DBVPG\